MSGWGWRRRSAQPTDSRTGLPTRPSMSTSVSMVNFAVFWFTTSDTRGRDNLAVCRQPPAQPLRRLATHPTAAKPPSINAYVPGSGTAAAARAATPVSAKSVNTPSTPRRM